MKRCICFLLVLILAASVLPLQARAADAGSKAGVVSVSYGSLNVRSTASTSGSIVATLSKGSYVTLMNQSGSWWRVEYADGKYGYCHASYISSASSTVSSVKVSGSLNVRSGPGTGYSRTGSLYNGKTVLVLSTDRGWSKILYNGTKTGWVSSQYLSSGTGSGSGGSGSTGNPALKLSVPSYKQTDSRWASVTLGSSGKTIASIGCTTTAIAMMESFRTGTTIYPDTMAGKLRYTSSGSVYWPDHYTVDTSSSGYLSRVYALLKAGKPVLFGAKNRYGSQHWVVITGFTGGEIIPANFTINDPGTASRTTLAQFLKDYPTFYKFFSY